MLRQRGIQLRGARDTWRRPAGRKVAQRRPIQLAKRENGNVETNKLVKQKALVVEWTARFSWLRFAGWPTRNRTDRHTHKFHSRLLSPEFGERVARGRKVAGAPLPLSLAAWLRAPTSSSCTATCTSLRSAADRAERESKRDETNAQLAAPKISLSKLCGQRKCLALKQLLFSLKQKLKFKSIKWLLFEIQICFGHKIRSNGLRLEQAVVVGDQFHCSRLFSRLSSKSWLV